MRNTFSFATIVVVLGLFTGCTASDSVEFTPLFNGVNLDGWVPVNVAPSTFTVQDSMIICSGFPTGIMRTERQYENFILEMEWRHLTEGGNAGLFVHTDALPIKGMPFPRTLEAQILDGNPGDLFAMMGAEMTPDPGTAREDREGSSRPQENRINPLGEWNHYRIESNDGRVTLSINGKQVAGGTDVIPRTGYICLESEGAEAHFRNIRIHELPSTNPLPSEQGTAAQGFASLYNGLDFSGWNTGSNEAWVADNFRFRNEPDNDAALLMTEDESFADYTLMFDWQIEEDATADHIVTFYPRGENGPHLVGGVGDGPFAAEDPVLLSGGVSAGEWHRTIVNVTGSSVSVTVDGESALDNAEVDMNASGPLGFAVDGATVTFTNVFLKRE